MDLKEDQPTGYTDVIYGTCHICTCTVPVPDDVQLNVKVETVRT